MSTTEAIELFKKVRLRFGDERHIEAAHRLAKSNLSDEQIGSIEFAVRHRQPEQRDLPLTEEPNADRAA